MNIRALDELLDILYVIALLTKNGRHRAPEPSRRSMFEYQLSEDACEAHLLRASAPSSVHRPASTATSSLDRTTNHHRDEQWQEYKCIQQSPVSTIVAICSSDNTPEGSIAANVPPRMMTAEKMTEPIFRIASKIASFGSR